MGAWGVEAFANDYALDDVELLSSKAGVLAALGRLLEMVDGEEDGWFVYTGYGAAEVVAAAVSAEPYYQSEGTTLFAGDEGMEYLPEEIAGWLEKERPSFSRAEIEAALEAVAVLSLPELLAPWGRPEARQQALEATRQRLLAGLERASD